MFLEIFFFVALLMSVVMTAVALSAQKDRRPAALWCLSGFLAACLKVWLIQQTPQWLDVSPDSRLYQLHAQALALHWQGEPVDALSYKLHGFLASWASGRGLAWDPDMTIAYSGVLGTHEWLYAALLGGWQLITDDWIVWATYSNAALAAMFPAAAYGIARCLGASPKVASVAAVLALVDPSSGVNASWLLKDTLAGFLAVTAIWGVLRTLQAPDESAPLVLLTAAAGLACVRFAGFAALLLAVVVISMTLFGRIWRQSLKHLGICVLASLVLFSVLYSSPQPLTLRSLVIATALPLEAQEATLNADEGQRASDSTVMDWQTRWREDPLMAIVTSVARTLFAPYPWVALTHGLSGTNSIELYYPGLVLWIACLPGILWGIPTSLRRAPREGLFLACMLLALLGAYTLFLGEWSTRQRVFMLPVFFGYAAVGWHDLYRRSKALVAAYRNKSRSSPTEP